MKIKNFYFIQSIFYITLGLLILMNIPGNILGAAIGISRLEKPIELLFSILFIAGGITLLIVSKKK
ncbi:MAG: hypothetical protein QXI33_01580 [Candidatus Pacearchaeota archaeon]